MSQYQFDIHDVPTRILLNGQDVTERIGSFTITFTGRGRINLALDIRGFQNGSHFSAEINEVSSGALQALEGLTA